MSVVELYGDKIRTMAANGCRLREIAEVCGVSRQRIYQILSSGEERRRIEAARVRVAERQFGRFVRWSHTTGRWLVSAARRLADVGVMAEWDVQRRCLMLDGKRLRIVQPKCSGRVHRMYETEYYRATVSGGHWYLLLIPDGRVYLVPPRPDGQVYVRADGTPMRRVHGERAPVLVWVDYVARRRAA